MIEDSSELDLLEGVIALKLIDVAGLGPGEASLVQRSDIDSSLAEQRCPTRLMRGPLPSLVLIFLFGFASGLELVALVSEHYSECQKK